MNHLLELAIIKYKSYGYDLMEIIDWHLENGIVTCNEDVFAIGYYAIDSDPMTPVEYNKSNTLFGTMCVGNMRQFFNPFKSKFKFVSFQRSFNGSDRVRLYEMDKFFKKLKK